MRAQTAYYGLILDIKFILSYFRSFLTQQNMLTVDHLRYYWYKTGSQWPIYSSHQLHIPRRPLKVFFSSAIGSWWETIYQGFMRLSPKSRNNSSCFYMRNNHIVRLQFCTCHDSCAAVACAKLWPDWHIEIYVKANRISTRFSVMSSWIVCDMGHS